MICTFRHHFWVLASCLLGNLGMDPDRVQPTQMCVTALSWNISRSRNFPKKLFIQTVREKYRESRKIMIWISLSFRLICWFSPNFFFTFSNLKFFGNWQKWPSRALNWIIFLALMCSLGCIWPIKNGFLSVSRNLELGF